MSRRVGTKTGVRPTGSRAARDTRPSTAKKIDLSSLRSEGFQANKASAWQNDEDAATLHWTRKIGEGGARNAAFKVVGIAPSSRRESEDKPSKLTTKWKMSQATDKWSEDPEVVFIPNVLLETFNKFFPGLYTDNEDLLADPDATIPIFIAGPRDQVIRALEHQLVLPIGSVDGDLVGNANDWVSDVSINAENYQGIKKEEYDQFLALDEEVASEKAVDLNIDVRKINDILWVASVVRSRGKKVDLLDVNGGYIGKYGGVIEKPVNNVFTDFLVSKIRKGMTEFKPMSINITSLAVPTKDSKPQLVKNETSREDIADGKYGTTQRRPLDVSITIHIDGQSIEIPRYTISTAEADAVHTLFAEIKAVNNARPDGIYYTVSGNEESVRSSVAGLLQSVKPRGTGGSREKEGPAPEYASKLYGKSS